MHLLDGLAELIDPETKEGAETPPLRYVLHRELLGLPSLTLNERWEPEVADLERLLGELERLAAAEPADLRQAFAAQAQARDHSTTGWVLDALLLGLGAGSGATGTTVAGRAAVAAVPARPSAFKVDETRDNIERAGLLRPNRRGDPLGLSGPRG